MERRLDVAFRSHAPEKLGQDLRPVRLQRLRRGVVREVGIVFHGQAFGAHAGVDEGGVDGVVSAASASASA